MKIDVHKPRPGQKLTDDQINSVINQSKFAKVVEGAKAKEDSEVDALTARFEKAQREMYTDVMALRQSGRLNLRPAQTGEVEDGFAAQGSVPRPMEFRIAEDGTIQLTTYAPPAPSSSEQSAAAATTVTAMNTINPAHKAGKVDPYSRVRSMVEAVPTEQAATAMAADGAGMLRAFGFEVSKENEERTAQELRAAAEAGGGLGRIDPHRAVAMAAEAGGEKLDPAVLKARGDRLHALVEPHGFVHPMNEIEALFRECGLIESGAGAAAAPKEQHANSVGSWLANRAATLVGGGGASLVTNNAATTLFPGANVVTQGIGAALTTLGMMRSSSQTADPLGLKNTVFPGLQGMENEIRTSMAKAVLAGSGGKALLSGGFAGTPSGQEIGRAVAGDGTMGWIAGTGLSMVSNLGGFSSIPGLSTGGPRGIEGALYGDSSNRMKFQEAKIARTASFVALTQNRSLDIDELMLMFAAFVIKQGDEDIREAQRQLAVKENIKARQELMEEKWQREKGKAAGTGKLIEGAAAAVGGLVLGPFGGMAGSFIGGKLSKGMVKPFEIAEESGAKDMVKNALSGQGIFDTNNESVDAIMVKVTAAQERYRRNYEMIVNLMKSRHDTGMTAVNAMRA